MKIKIYYILQSGFSEGCQLRCAEKYLEKLTPMLGCEYGGCLVKGDNFGIRFFEGKMLDKTLDQVPKEIEIVKFDALHQVK